MATELSSMVPPFIFSEIKISPAQYVTQDWCDFLIIRLDNDATNYSMIQYYYYCTKILTIFVPSP